MKHLAPLLFSFLLLQCTKEKTLATEKMLVDHKKIPCTGFIPQECYLVKIGEDYPDGEWTYFYSEIEGFDYTTGFIYDIEIEKIERNPIPQDASMYRYLFVRLISKEPAG